MFRYESGTACLSCSACSQIPYFLSQSAPSRTRPSEANLLDNAKRHKQRVGQKGGREGEGRREGLVTDSVHARARARFTQKNGDM